MSGGGEGWWWRGAVARGGVLSADQHQNLILRKYSTATNLKLTGYWDLWDVTPLFNVPSCVLFAKRDPLTGTPRDKLPVKEWSGKLPGRDVSWDVAKARLTVEEKEGRVIYLGTRAALSTAPGASSPSNPSKYQVVFKQGATILPRSFYFVRVDGLEGVADPAAQYWVETDPEQAAEAKKPYDDIHLKGLVEGKFIYTSAVSRHILPYTHLTPVNVVLPVSEANGVLTMITADKMTREGYREFAKWMKQVEEMWAARRGEKSGKQSAYERLDYSGGISVQNLRPRHLVLYNAAGTNVSATYFDRGKHPRFVVEHKLYWAAFSSPQEAHYLSAILNSETGECGHQAISINGFAR